MASVIFGCLLLAVGVALRISIAVHLRHKGESIRPAFKRLYVPATPWVGLILVVLAVSHLLAKILVLGAFLPVLVIGLVRGIWRVPTAVRFIGDPEAWRGKRRAYWDQSAERAT